MLGSSSFLAFFAVDSAHTCLLCISQIAKTAVYSLNKTSTREFIERKAQTFGFKGTVIAQMRVRLSRLPFSETRPSLFWMLAHPLVYLQYDLPQTMSFHKKKTVDMRVDTSSSSLLRPADPLPLPQRGGHVAIRADPEAVDLPHLSFSLVVFVVQPRAASSRSERERRRG